MAKNFKKSAAEMFFERNEDLKEKAEFVVPKGYRLVREYKTARMQLLIRESTKAALKRMALIEGVSLNEFANRVLDSYVEAQEEES